MIYTATIEISIDTKAADINIEQEEFNSRIESLVNNMFEEAQAEGIEIVITPSEGEV